MVAESDPLNEDARDSGSEDDKEENRIVYAE